MQICVMGQYHINSGDEPLLDSVALSVGGLLLPPEPVLAAVERGGSGGRRADRRACVVK